MPYVHIDWGDIDNREFLYEFTNRYWDDSEISEILTSVKPEASAKLQFIIGIIDKYSLVELQKKFNDEDLRTSAGENQLTLEFK